MYGVVLHFDLETERIIKTLWKKLSDSGISNYAYEIENRKPHITLADYSELKVSEYKGLFDCYYKSVPRMYLSYNTLGTFMNSGALFLSPNPTKELIDFHSNYHNHFMKYNAFSNLMYHPERWIPHCTIANHLDDQKLLEALHFTTKRLESMQTEVQEISLIKIIYQNNKRVIETVISKALI
ncbi:2'-5' RNA ligase family protein [Paenibacillus sp. FSL R5-0519]|uniref:2'-5' RNA ligase family protein n=1 Tax=Paenibacillus sp. FSL R5-0519 TaxID=2921648 RepID=UPI0030D994BF